MPKDKRVDQSSFERTMASPYARSMKVSDGNDSNNSWEDVRCPICMEHPHNAVELQCSSRDKGCRPFMCDTSYRHSNCLDLYCKSSSSSPEELKDVVVCPLCRGTVTGWNVKLEARKFMNSKTRSCSLETCDFSGNYAELRKHARLEHPTYRPSVASPTRESNWVALERERDLGDTVAHQFVDYFNYEWDDYLNSGDMSLPDFSSDSGTSYLSDDSILWSEDSSLDFSSGSFDFGNDDNDDVLEDMFGYAPLSFSFTLAPEQALEFPMEFSRLECLSIPRSGNRGESASSGLRAGATYRARRESSNRIFPMLRSSDARDDANTISSARPTNHRENVPAISRRRSSDRSGNGDLVPMGFPRVENSSNSISDNRRVSTLSDLRAGETYRARRESSSRTHPRLRSSNTINDANTNSSARSRYYRENAPTSSIIRSSGRRGSGEPNRVMRLSSDGSRVLPAVRRWPASRDLPDEP